MFNLMPHSYNGRSTEGVRHGTFLIPFFYTRLLFFYLISAREMAGLSFVLVETSRHRDGESARLGEDGDLAAGTPIICCTDESGNRRFRILWSACLRNTPVARGGPSRCSGAGAWRRRRR